MIKKFTDERGDFILFDTNGCDQVNVVINPQRYTFRGLHYQTDPSQRKTVKVIQGRVIDFLYNLDNKEIKMISLDKDSEPLIVENNYAHGYLTMEPNTIFTYAVEGEYNPDSEHSIIWKDVKEIFKLIVTLVPVNELVISEKDKNGK
jgi:dTDP-4-dehydrorhamnose 3,5-epimerase